jgi:SecD/SecF fusion protein
VGAVVCLLANLLMLFGAMVITQSTLTLAGIGGIVLTIGMAVDANILIFDRIREEQERGRKPLQAAKEGFAGANAAIIDGNLTTLITGIILQVIGTGTIKGFAVTLNVGILTSMFAALVIGRVMVHWQLKRGVEKWHMSRWLADANFKFINKAKIMVGISAAIIVVGGIGFLMQKDTKKLGIDFLGGASVKVRTEEPQSVDNVRVLVAKLPGELAGADVVDLPASRDSSGKAREFRVTFKTDPENANNPGIERQFQREVKTGLADVLQAEAVVVDVRTEGDKTLAKGELHFEKDHPLADVKSTLVATPGLTEVDASYRGQRTDVVDFTATAAAGTDPAALRTAIDTAFTGKADSTGRAYKLIGPVSESMVVGAQVVGELRDSAIKALALSALLMLLYIRVRFAEYSYGFGALLADLHDLFSTLAAIAFLIWIPWIHVEMNLTMIAAFLTILGYSINDTIIVYDRIRENRPRVKGTLREVIDLSVNQTLSRTILTSSTVIVAALIMLAFNFGTGNPLEGFAFALAWGVITGTFSSIYIASPLMMWIDEREERKRKAGNGKGGAKPVAPAAQSTTP